MGGVYSSNFGPLYTHQPMVYTSQGRLAGHFCPKGTGLKGTNCDNPSCLTPTWPSSSSEVMKPGRLCSTLFHHIQ